MAVTAHKSSSGDAKLWAERLIVARSLEVYYHERRPVWQSILAHAALLGWITAYDDVIRIEIPVRDSALVHLCGDLTDAEKLAYACELDTPPV